MENRCVCCGEIIPEGRQVCIRCEREAENEDCKISNQNQRRKLHGRGKIQPMRVRHADDTDRLISRDAKNISETRIYLSEEVAN